MEGPTPSDTSCGFDLTSADPELAPLASNGGPTETRALPLSSPAVDVVPKAHCPGTVDQRGEPRPEPGSLFCDVGAFERQDPVAPTITTGAAATFQVGTTGSFTIMAIGGPTPSLSLTGALPSGVAFTDNGDGTASLMGTPAPGTTGVYPITINAANGVSPDATQSFTLTVQAPATVPPKPEPPSPQPAPSPPKSPAPPKPLPFELSTDVERKPLGKLVQTGKLVVTAKVSESAKVRLSGRARLRLRAGGKWKTMLVAVFESKDVRFSAAGEKTVRLILTRNGRRALRHLRSARLVIVARATDAGGETTRATVELTLRRR